MDHLKPTGNDPLQDIRAILLTELEEQFRLLEERLAALQQHNQSSEQEQQAQWQAIRQQLQAIQRLAEEKERALQSSLDDLEQRALTDPEKITNRLTPMMTNLIRRTIVESPEEMAEAIGPVMGEAVRVQIRDSRQGMIDALYPIIGQTVQRAISEFARELQRNIDARLKSTFGPQGLLRTLSARLRGVSAGELALRDAMPFQISEIFLIQQNTGLLMAHIRPGSEELTSPDLVSSMLTAIRSFIQDAFGQEQGKELDEIQYGDESIIIYGGKHTYVAVAIKGVEPEGLRNQLRELVSELHIRFGNALRDYDGSPDSLPNVQPPVQQFIDSITGASAQAPQKIPAQQRLILAAGSFLLLLILAGGCFSLVFASRLWPVAFPGPSAAPSASATLTPTAPPTATLTPTPTATFTATPTSTFTPTAVATNTPTSSPSPGPTITATPHFVSGYIIGDVWARTQPSELSPRHSILFVNTPVKILAVFGYWVQVEWINVDGPQQAWILARWVVPLESIPAYLITPTPSP
jgi:hypothetical protein